MPLMWVRHLTSLEMVDMDEYVAEGANSRLPKFYLYFLSYVIALGTMLGLSMGEESFTAFIFRFLGIFKLLLFPLVISFVNC